jgi:hypothetical protein
MAQARVLEGLGPDTTLHVVQVGYRADPPPPGPWVLPKRWRMEYWAYLAPDGVLASLVSETRDADSGTLVQTASSANGVLTMIDTASGKTNKAPLAGTPGQDAALLRARLDELQDQSWTLVAADARAKSTAVNGQDAWVIDLTWARGIQRTYVGKKDYRELKWERMVGDAIIESRETPTFEVVKGNASPLALTAPGDTPTPTPGGALLGASPTPTPRAPGSAAITIGAPSRVGATVQVPINVTGTVDALGFNVHLRWDPGVFTFSSANANGSVVPSPLCAQAVDDDGAGIVYGCASIGSRATAEGLLATIVLTPAVSGCSSLHLITLAGPDAGGSGNGSYVIAPDNTPQSVAYGTDIRVNTNGQAC